MTSPSRPTIAHRPAPVARTRSRRPTLVLAATMAVTAIAAVPAVRTVAGRGDRAHARDHVAVAAIPPVADLVEPAGDVTIEATVAAPAERPLRRVLLVGDGIMFDLAPPIAAHLDSIGVEVSDRSYWGMGLTRPDRYDWEQRWAAAVAETQPDAVVVTVGPNDIEPRSVDGRLLTPGTRQWHEWYSSLLDRATQVLHSTGAPVYWIVMLPSGDPTLADEVDALNGAVRRLAERDPAIVVVDPALVLGASYREIAEDPQPRRLRQPDGKHLCAEGAGRVAPLVIDALRTRFAVASTATDDSWRAEPRYGPGGPDCPG